MISRMTCEFLFIDLLFMQITQVLEISKLFSYLEERSGHNSQGSSVTQETFSTPYIESQCGWNVEYVVFNIKHHS